MGRNDQTRERICQSIDHVWIVGGGQFDRCGTIAVVGKKENVENELVEIQVSSGIVYIYVCIYIKISK